MLLDAWQDWECPKCGVSDRTRPLPPGSAARMHDCAGLHGLTAPLVPAGTNCTLRAVPRGDYLAGEIQRAGDDGRPYMAVETVYGDGRNDVYAFAGVAALKGGA